MVFENGVPSIRTYQKIRENFMRRSFMICTALRILFE